MHFGHSELFFSIMRLSQLYVKFPTEAYIAYIDPRSTHSLTDTLTDLSVRIMFLTWQR